MNKTIYKGVEIRQYGTMRGEGVYPLAFTDDLAEEGQVRMHETIEDAKAYIDVYA